MGGFALDQFHQRFRPGQPVNAGRGVECGTRRSANLPPDLPTIRAGKHWATQASSSSEDAVLVFCPAPTTSIEDEAAWRLLAHLAQAPFYQRLRVELQLGYAVFSGLRQIDGRTGLLFGVQSPTSSAKQLFAHIRGLYQQTAATGARRRFA